MVKIDTDGADLHVSRGALGLLNRTFTAHFELWAKAASVAVCRQLVETFASAGLAPPKPAPI